MRVCAPTPAYTCVQACAPAICARAYAHVMHIRNAGLYTCYAHAYARVCVHICVCITCYVCRVHHTGIGVQCIGRAMCNRCGEYDTGMRWCGMCSRACDQSNGDTPSGLAIPVQLPVQLTLLPSPHLAPSLTLSVSRRIQLDEPRTYTLQVLCHCMTSCACVSTHTARVSPPLVVNAWYHQVAQGST